MKVPIETRKQPAATEREAVINGTRLPVVDIVPNPPPPPWILIKERFGTRLVRLSQISQVVCDTGQVGGGPWFVRCDGQQFPCTEAVAREIMGLLGISMEDVRS